MNLGTVKTGISQVGKIAFSFLKSNENFHPLSVEIETLVLRIGRNRIFWLPKCSKITHTKLGTCRKFSHTERGTLSMWISRDGKKEISCLKNEKISPFFPWYQQIAFSGYQNAENLLQRSLVYVKNLLTRSLVPLKLGFTTRQTPIFRPQKL